MNAHDETEWSAPELAALRALGTGDPVSPRLADSTVAALRSRGLLRRRQPAWYTQLPLATAAALVLFIGGHALGQARGTRIGHELAVTAMAATPQAAPAELAFIVQRTGSAYVQALAVLAAQQHGGTQLEQAREAAVNITEVALREVASIAQDTATRARLARPLQPAAGRAAIWY